MQVRTFQLGRSKSSRSDSERSGECQLILLDPQRERLTMSCCDRQRRPRRSKALAASERAALGQSPLGPARPVPIGKASVSASAPSGDWPVHIARTVPAASTLAFKVQDTESERYYFLKFVPRESLGNTEVVKRFARECEILTSLDHPI